MLSKFDEQLELTKGNKRVLACGPLIWAPGEQGQCKITVSITQNGVVARGETGSYNQGDDRWECNADADSALQANAQATSHGVIQMRGSGHADPWPDQHVTLVP